ncbi:MAG TPA: hypothetical protein VH560_06920 [Polyangia bacterium]|jgi:hypothetical protein|nr:hypothetical protein [Polyangia bacterium]
MLALGMGATACTSFPDVSSVLDLRVLSVQTDPSEVILTIDGLPSDPSAKIDPSALSIDPMSIPAIGVTPLVVDPPADTAGSAVTWSVSACPNVPYGAAPPSAGGMGDPAGSAGTTVGSTLCTEGAPNTWPLASGLVGDAPAQVTLTAAQLLTAFESDVFRDQYGNVHGGFDLGMPLNLQLTFNGGGETTTAIKRVLFWSHRVSADQKVNVIPTIPSVTGYVDRDPSTWLPTSPLMTLDPAAPTHVTLGKGIYLLPKYTPLPPAGAPPDPNGPTPTPETYVTTVLSRDPPYQAIPTIETERIRYAFYATAGTFSPQRTVDQNPPGSTPPPNATGTTIHLESQYQPPATLDDVPVDAATGLHLVTVWIVVRDDRGGESWVIYKLALDAPAN